METQDRLDCDEWEDETWWGEVVSSLASIECTSQRSTFSNQVNTEPKQALQG